MNTNVFRAPCHVYILRWISPCILMAGATRGMDFRRWNRPSRNSPLSEGRPAFDNTFRFFPERRLLCLFFLSLSLSLYLSLYLCPPSSVFLVFFTFIVHVRCTLSITTGQCPVSLSAVNSLHVQQDFSFPSLLHSWFSICPSFSVCSFQLRLFHQCVKKKDFISL